MKVIHIGSQMDFSSNSVPHFTTLLKIFILILLFGSSECNRSDTEMKKQFGKVTELNTCCDPLFEVRNNNNSLKYTITIDYTQHGLCYDSLLENVIM